MDGQIRTLVTFAGLKQAGWPLCRVHTFRLVRKGVFPRPLKLGSHPNSRVVWYLDEVQAFLETWRVPN